MKLMFILFIVAVVFFVDYAGKVMSYYCTIKKGEQGIDIMRRIVVKGSALFVVIIILALLMLWR